MGDIDYGKKYTVTVSYNEDEKIDIIEMLQYRNYKIVIEELDLFFRNQIKYGEYGTVIDRLDTLQEARDQLKELCSEYDVSIW